MAVGGDEERLLLPLEYVVAHGHGFGGGGGLVEEGGVGHGEGGEIGDHSLEVEEGLEPPLGDLGLVGGVLGVPPGVLQEVAEDDAGDEGVVVPHADEGFVDLVHRGQALHVGDHLALGQPLVEFGEIHRRDADGFGDGGVDQGVEGGESDGGCHGGLVGGGGGVVPAREGVGGLQGLQRDLAGLLVLVAVGPITGFGLGEGGGQCGEVAGGGGLGVGDEAAEEGAAGEAASSLHC